MSKTFKALFVILFLFVVAVTITLIVYGSRGAVLDPKGMIAVRERDLMYIAFYLMWIVVIPVFVFAVIFVWRYRAGNPSAKYTPDHDRSQITETIWWGVPFIIIFVLGIFTLKSSFDLDPFKPIIVTGVKPLRIQVIALQWKWLFIYPDQKIATVNYLQIPKETPIAFEITADAPMNSFWIPALAGQIYAMPGMKAKLHLIANETGMFRGCSANLSGTGFASMVFWTKATTGADFDAWVESAKGSPNRLGASEYEQLAMPSSYLPAKTYVLELDELYDQIVMKYMMPM